MACSVANQCLSILALGVRLSRMGEPSLQYLEPLLPASTSGMSQLSVVMERTMASQASASSARCSNGCRLHPTIALLRAILRRLAQQWRARSIRLSHCASHQDARWLGSRTRKPCQERSRVWKRRPTNHFSRTQFSKMEVLPAKDF
jgi:hypothetical protein